MSAKRHRLGSKIGPSHVFRPVRFQPTGPKETYSTGYVCILFRALVLHTAPILPHLHTPGVCSVPIPRHHLCSIHPIRI